MVEKKTQALVKTKKINFSTKRVVYYMQSILLKRGYIIVYGKFEIKVDVFRIVLQR